MKVPPGASGSSTIRANDAAFSGASDHVSGGEWSAPSQVNSTGMGAPSLNAELESAMRVLVLEGCDISARLVKDAADSPQKSCTARRNSRELCRTWLAHRL